MFFTEHADIPWKSFALVSPAPHAWIRFDSSPACGPYFVRAVDDYALTQKQMVCEKRRPVAVTFVACL